VSGSPESIWRAALAEGRLLLQRASASGAHFFPPRLAEPRTGDEDWDWVEASGLGTVHSVTVVNQRSPAVPYNVALIDLDEGVRLMSRVEGLAAEDVRIGLRVRARIDASVETPILLFDPA
jgi:uncharacterized OB-fold protein